MDNLRIEDISIVDECFGSNSINWISIEKKKELSIIERDKTVIITFSGGIIRKYGYIDSKKINISEDINLNCTYVKDLNIGCKQISLSAQYSFFDGDSIFNGTCFSNLKISFSHSIFSKGNVDFRNSKFEGNSTRFTNCTFNCKVVNFGRSDFYNNKVDFSKSIFYNCYVSFKLADFHKAYVIFSEVKFGEGKINFESVFFDGGNINFRKAHFMGSSVNFRWTNFGTGELCFRDVIFITGKMRFVGCHLKNKKITFEDASYDSLIFSNCLCYCYIYARVEKARLIIFDNCHLHDFVDLKVEKRVIGLSLYKTKITGKIFINWEKNGVKNLIKNGRTLKYKENQWLELIPSSEEIADQFLLLKENFRNVGQYKCEDSSYFEYKKYEAKSIKEKSKDKSLIVRLYSIIVPVTKK